MTEGRSGQPVVTVKPQSDLYTFLIILAVVTLAVTVGFVLYNLLSPDGYGMDFGALFRTPPAAPVAPGTTP